MRNARSTLANLLVLVILAAGGFLLYQNRYAIEDWYYLRNYTPPAQVASLASQATLTDSGRRLFYRAQPQIDTGRESLVRDCQIKGDKTIELGCYLSTDKIYLLNITQPELKNEMIVTAAHETLHAVYDRMDSSEKHNINVELERAAANITDPELKKRLAEYNLLEPGEQDNELHSILGSEYPNLSPTLETHYAQYFANRAQIVSYSQQFNQSFEGLHTEIVQLDEHIKSTKAQMQSLLAANQIRQYNAMVPGINAEICSYNEKVTLYNQYASELLGQESVAGTEQNTNSSVCLKP